MDAVHAIESIKSKAIGTDGLSPIFLKIILPYVADSICNIFNSSYPEEWKCARVIPIQKKKTRPLTYLIIVPLAYCRSYQKLMSV